MSTRSSSKARFGPRVQVQDVVRVTSGSPAKFVLKSELGTIKGPQAALALAKRHLPLEQAHAIVNLLFDRGEVVIDVPVVEDSVALSRDLARCNVVAKVLKATAETAGRR